MRMMMAKVVNPIVKYLLRPISDLLLLKIENLLTDDSNND
jgi:hypothetical protein